MGSNSKLALILKQISKNSPRQMFRHSVFFVLTILTLSWTMLVSHALAQSPTAVHGLAMHGKPKYGPDFTHFEYANPNAPKGGSLRIASSGTFDSFHQYIDRGISVPTLATETLLVSSSDEAFSLYGLIAESMEVPEDRSWIIFNLRPQARWHDGEPITAEDVVWTFETLVSEGANFFQNYYENVAKVEELSEYRVKFTFSGGKNQELPLIVGQMPVLPKHYWADRDFKKTTLEPPLGSGPYRVKEFEPGRYVVYERVEDYWGADLPVNVGKNNFDSRRTDFYRDDTAIRLALKSGELDLRFENQAKAWASDYDIAAVEHGWLKKETIKHHRPSGMQAFVMNIRREPFSNRKVRKALAYAFDFEWSNKTLFFSQYTRTESYFSNSELAATGLPQGEELEILERYKDRIPPEIFTEPYRAPTTDGSGWPRENLKEAFRLLAEAGWVVKDLKLVNEQTGQQMSIEILLGSQSFERVMLPFARNLERLGIDTQIRLVDPTQYGYRVHNRDFDMIVSGWGQSDSPGNEQRGKWGSYVADVPYSENYLGIKDPVIDEIIELIVQAPDRESLVNRTKALDRVLLHGHYVIPNWHSQSHRALYWDKFSRPDGFLKNGVSISHWWYDEAKAAVLAENIQSGLSDIQVESAPAKLNQFIAVIAIFVVIGMFGYFYRRRRQIDIAS